MEREERGMEREESHKLDFEKFNVVMESFKHR